MPRVYATIGRAADNDVVLEHPTVSNHHARLSWTGGALLVEDLSSANGTFVDGQRVKSARTRPGVDLRLGQVQLPWSHEGLKTLLKAGAGARTLVMPTQRAPTFVCGSCGHVGTLPEGPVPAQVTCPSCETTLSTGKRPQAGGLSRSWLVLPLSLLLGGAIGFHLLSGQRSPGSPALPGATTAADARNAAELGARSPEQRIGVESAAKIAAALTPMDSLTRNTAAQLAARNQGPFHVEQVAEIWASVRKDWRYVNDPEGREYFATARESIENGYVGDCDDFAITLSSMVIAVGGKARVVLMDGPGGGHAYAEACVQGEPAKVASALVKHYKTRFKRYLPGAVPKAIAYRSSEDCPIWLNLDWNAAVPGGPYEPEHWAVAVYEGGRTETLAPANPASQAGTADTRDTHANEPNPP